jgi:hypothetical protein
MRRMLATAGVVATVIVATVGERSSDATPSSGVRGVLVLSHGCPGPVSVEHPRHCGYPGAGIRVRVFQGHASAPLRSGRTDANGHFAFALRPGRYVVHVELQQEKSATFAVRFGRWTKLSLRYLVPPLME